MRMSQCIIDLWNMPFYVTYKVVTSSGYYSLLMNMELAAKGRVNVTGWLKQIPLPRGNQRPQCEGLDGIWRGQL